MSRFKDRALNLETRCAQLTFTFAGEYCLQDAVVVRRTHVLQSLFLIMANCLFQRMERIKLVDVLSKKDVLARMKENRTLFNHREEEKLDGTIL